MFKYNSLGIILWNDWNDQKSIFEILPNKTNHILSYQKSTIADLNQLLHKIMCTEGFHETNVLLLFKTIKTQGQNIAKFSRKNRKLCRAHCAQNWKKYPNKILELQLTRMTLFSKITYFKRW